MSPLTFLFVSVFAVVSFIGSILAYHQCRYKKNAFGITPIYAILFSGFVWADVLIFGIFWTLISLFCLLAKDGLLFLLIYSVFWFVRCAGESLYWFLQQFSTLNKNPHERFFVHRIVKNDAVWFMNQIYWQCLTVVTFVTTLYLSVLWIRELF